MRCSAVKLVRIFLLLKKFPVNYWTWMFIIIFVRAHLWSLFWARWIQLTPSLLSSLRLIQIFFFHLCVGPPFPYKISNQNFCAYFWSLPCAACPTILILLMAFDEEHKLCFSFSCSSLRVFWLLWFYLSHGKTKRFKTEWQ
jgi:hypothetical protein